MTKFCVVLLVEHLDFPQLCGNVGEQELDFAEARRIALDLSKSYETKSMVYQVMLWSDYQKIAVEGVTQCNAVV